jgi:hypothetical protein
MQYLKMLSDVAKEFWFFLVLRDGGYSVSIEKYGLLRIMHEICC